MKKRKARMILIAVLAVVVIAEALLVYGFRHTRIPKLYFQGNISGMEDKSDVRDISVRYVSGGQTVDAFAEIKIQGTSSLSYEKKNYTINFFSDANHSEKLKLDVGLGGEQSKYCLKANWIDRTHSRNVVTARLATQVQQKYQVLTQAPRNGTIDGFPVEIYSNGKFLGLYTFNIPKDPWLFNMDEENPNHIVVCGERWEDTNLFRGEPDFDNWELEVGENSEETLDKLKKLFDFVMNSDDETFCAQFEEHIDLDAALNYYILADFAYMADNLGKNMLLATYDGQKWYPVLYDLDTTWGTSYSGRGLMDYENNTLNLSSNLLFERLEKSFGKELSARYFELRQEILTKEHILGEFEAFHAQIPGAVFLKEGFRWGCGVLRQYKDLPGFDYDQIEDYLDTIPGKLDEKYAALAGR